jgi:hypothetical protein
MAKDSGWISWDRSKTPKPGTRLRLKFQNGNISNPITFIDGRGLGWGNHEYSWSANQAFANRWRIVEYQILN